MAEVGKLYLTVMPDMSKFAGAMKGASVNQAASGLSRVLTTGLGVALGNALTTGWNAFMGSLDQGISRIDTINAFPRVMQNIGVEADAATHAMEMLVQSVDGMPTSLDAAVAATQRFTLANGDVERSAQMFDALNNALLGGGMSAEAQAQALEQISQAYAKGKPDYQEWLSMTQNMGPALNMVAKAWGMSTDEMREALKDGSASMDDFFDTLIQLNEEGIDGFSSLSDQADVTMQNIGTAMANVKNRFAQSWGAIIDEIGQDRIAGAINGVSSAFRDAFKNTIAPAIGDVTEGLAAFFEGASGAPEELGPLGTAVFEIADALSGLADAANESLAPIFDSIGSAISDNLPTIEELVDAITGFIDLIADNFDTVLTFAAMFAAFNGIMALAPVITALAGGFTAIVGGIGAVTATLAGLAEGFALVAGGAATVGEVIALLGTSLFPVIGVIAAIGVAIALNWDTVSAWLQELGAGFVELGEWFMSVGAAADTFFGETIPNAIDTGLRAIGQWLSEGLAGWVSLFETGINAIKDYFVNGIQGWGNLIKTGINNIHNYFSTGIAGWKRLFDTFVEGIRSIPQRIVGFFSGIGQKITNAIGNIHFPMPHVTWEEVGLGIKLPKVKWYAQGGFVNGAQLIGAGEKGTELIWPSYGSALDKYGAAIAEHMDGGGTVYNLYINDARVNDDPQIRGQFIDLMQTLQRKGAMNDGA